MEVLVGAGAGGSAVGACPSLGAADICQTMTLASAGRFFFSQSRISRSLSISKISFWDTSSHRWHNLVRPDAQRWLHRTPKAAVRQTGCTPASKVTCNRVQMNDCRYTPATWLQRKCTAATLLQLSSLQIRIFPPFTIKL